jgi:hypothetical protein
MSCGGIYTNANDTDRKLLGQSWGIWFVYSQRLLLYILHQS